MIKFYVGLHHPGDAKHFERAFISINAMRDRKGSLRCPDWILDSGAFREIEQHGGYRHSPTEYAQEINRIGALNPGLAAAVSQDWMCEDFILAKTGLTISDHQRLTIERYDELLRLINGVYLMPVLQGYKLADLHRAHRPVRRPLMPWLLCGRRFSVQEERQCRQDRGRAACHQAPAPRPAIAWVRSENHGALQRRGSKHAVQC